MKPFTRRLGMILMILLAGCSVSRPIHRETADIGALPAESRIRVYADSGKLYEMRFEEIRNDTLFGYTSVRNVRLPRARIDSLFLVRSDPGRSLGLALASLFIANVAIVALWLASGP